MFDQPPPQKLTVPDPLIGLGPKPPVLAMADCQEVGWRKYVVTVWGRLRVLPEGCEQQRIYHVAALNQDQAAFEGIRRFCEEMRRPKDDARAA